MDTSKRPKIAVVIPCYRAKTTILDVLSGIGSLVDHIIIVDDGCPEHTGNWVNERVDDPRLVVLVSESNQGVGGAVICGYKKAIDVGADIVVKIDADGQMDPALIGKFIKPILEGRADYAKGNRFFSLESLRGMPTVRLLGNAILSFISKASSGYWNIMDPTNGYVAIHAKVINALPLEKIDHGYFFESDMLFRLYTLRAVVLDIPIDATYRDEISSLKISSEIGSFLFKHFSRFCKRVFYCYFLRDFNIASAQLLSGILLVSGGSWFGAITWLQNMTADITTPTGTVMLAVLPVLVGIQLMLSAIQYDIASIPSRAIHELLPD